VSSSRRSSGRGISPVQARRAIADCLRARKGEIEQELLAGVEALLSSEVGDPEYVDGLRKSVSAAFGYGIEGIESSELSRPAVPAILYTQARLAARNGVDLGTVVQRYINGYAMLERFVDEAAEAEGLFGTTTLKEIRRVSSNLLKDLIATVSEQYEQETRAQASSPKSRLAKLVRQMVDGEPIDTSQFNYDFDGFHLGLVANGSATCNAIKELASSLDCISMVIEISDASTWAWLGRRRPPDISRVQGLVAKRWPSRSFLAIGEIGEGRVGWRRTHQQASSALPVSLQRSDRFFRYGEDPFLVTLLQDNVLAQSLRQMYLVPLSEGADGGHKLRETLRAYFAAARKSALAAETLGVSRQTVSNHLQTVEARLGRTLVTCTAELEAALRLDEFDRSSVDPLSDLSRP
jgi:hypothetical protein